jgi:hypothetical protein
MILDLTMLAPFSCKKPGAMPTQREHAELTDHDTLTQA